MASPLPSVTVPPAVTEPASVPSSLASVTPLGAVVPVLMRRDNVGHSNLGPDYRSLYQITDPWRETVRILGSMGGKHRTDKSNFQTLQLGNYIMGKSNKLDSLNLLIHVGIKPLC